MAWTEIKNGDFFNSSLPPHHSPVPASGAEGHLSALQTSLLWLLPLRMEKLFMAIMENYSSCVYCSLSHLLLLFLTTCASFCSGDWICFHHQPLPLRSWWSPGLGQLQGDLFPHRPPSLLTAFLFSLNFLQVFYRSSRSVQSLHTGHGAFQNYIKLNHFRWEWILGCLQ